MKVSHTCLAVIRHNEHLYFAGDRRVSWGMHKAQVGTRPKVSYRGGVLFAGTGASAMCDEIVELFDVPHRKSLDPFTYFHTELLPSIIDHLRVKEYVAEDSRGLIKDSKGKCFLSSVILVGIDDQLFEIDLNGDCILGDAIDAPYAHGCGGDYALGAILALHGLGLNPERILTNALQIAASISPGCDDRVDIVTNNPEFVED